MTKIWSELTGSDFYVEPRGYDWLEPDPPTARADVHGRPVKFTVGGNVEMEERWLPLFMEIVKRWDSNKSEFQAIAVACVREIHESKSVDLEDLVLDEVEVTLEKYPKTKAVEIVVTFRVGGSYAGCNQKDLLQFNENTIVELLYPILDEKNIDWTTVETSVLNG